MSEDNSTTYVVTDCPSWVSVNPETGGLLATPTNSAIGNHPIVLTKTYTDGVVETENFTVVVSDVDGTLTVTSEHV